MNYPNLNVCSSQRLVPSVYLQLVYLKLLHICLRSLNLYFIRMVFHDNFKISLHFKYVYLVGNYILLIAASLMIVIGVLVFCIIYYRAAGHVILMVEWVFRNSPGWASTLQLFYASFAVVSLLICIMFWIPNIYRLSIFTTLVCIVFNLEAQYLTKNTLRLNLLAIHLLLDGLLF